MRTPWQIPALILLALVIGAMLALQHQANGELRGVIGLLREQNREVERLRAERRRLVDAQVPAAKLESLRADHAAVARLRGEIERARTRLIEMEQAESPPLPRN